MANEQKEPSALQLRAVQRAEARSAQQLLNFYAEERIRQFLATDLKLAPELISQIKKLAATEGKDVPSWLRDFLPVLIEQHIKEIKLSAKKQASKKSKVFKS